jgi:hypothetical protein
LLKARNVIAAATVADGSQSRPPQTLRLIASMLCQFLAVW